MKKHNTTSPPRLAAWLVGAALLGLVSQSALALGTASGTVINNSATLNYTVGGVTQTSISAAATFMVDEKVNLTVTGGATTTVVPNQLAAVTTFTVTNNANSPLDFGLLSNQVAAGDNFDATACIVRVESNPVPDGYQAATDTATFIDELAVDTTATVYVVCNIPSTVVNTNTALVGLTATALGTFTGANGTYVATPGAQGAVIVATVGANTPSTVDIVFADIAGTEGDTARDSRHSARDTYAVLSGVLVVTKTVALLCDPFNGITSPKNIPGAVTQWSLAITNTGAAAATLTTITDTLAAVLVHDANLIVPTTAANCVSATGVPESAVGKGFKVTANAARTIGATLATIAGYFTTAIDSDGVDISGQAITATFAAILPADGGHATAGLLNVGETVTIIFNSTVL